MMQQNNAELPIAFTNRPRHAGSLPPPASIGIQQHRRGGQRPALLRSGCAHPHWHTSNGLIYLINNQSEEAAQRRKAT